jgi:hypothetical protein
MKVYVLFETDTHKSKKSRVFLGLFDSEEKAIDHAKKNNCYTNFTDVVILECKLNEFLEQ